MILFLLNRLIFRKKIFAVFVLFALPLSCKPYQNLFKPCKGEVRSSIQGIDGIYVINLDVRPERWHRLEPILFYHGIDAVRFSAVWGWDLDFFTIQEYCMKHLMIGQLGCMLSHLSVYSDALQRGLKVVWVMEDDVEIKRDPQILSEILEELDGIDPEWDVLYTDLDFCKADGTFVRSLALPWDKIPPFPPHPLEHYTYRKTVSKNLQLIRARYGTASMILSERGMKKALDHFLTYEDILWPYDIEFHYIPGIRQYGIVDPVASNGHFSYNFSDAGKFPKDYYEISDDHVRFIEERRALFSVICENWLSFFHSKTNFH